MGLAPFLDNSFLGERIGAIALAGLYLPGLEGRPHDVPKRSWRAVLGVVLRSACPLGRAAGELRAAGLWAEALVLEAPGVLSLAERLVEAERVVTAFSDGYPQRWLKFEFAPPAIYCAGGMGLGDASFLSIVGSRVVSAGVRAFAAEVGLEAARFGYTVFSGGAAGCDKAGVSRVGTFVELLPRGLNGLEPNDGGCRLSLRPFREPFSVGAAMERNALIYAASEHSVVAHARFKQGGTWTGATEALRRKLTRLIVRRDLGELGHRALASLGAFELEAPAQLKEALEAQGGQQDLFGDA